MFTYLKRMFLDESAFFGLIRSVLGVTGVAIQSGQVLPEFPGSEFLGLAAIGFALQMRSSTHEKVKAEKQGS